MCDEFYFDFNPPFVSIRNNSFNPGQDLLRLNELIWIILLNIRKYDIEITLDI